MNKFGEVPPGLFSINDVTEIDDHDSPEVEFMNDMDEEIKVSDVVRDDRA